VATSEAIKWSFDDIKQNFAVFILSKAFDNSIEVLAFANRIKATKIFDSPSSFVQQSIMKLLVAVLTIFLAVSVIAGDNIGLSNVAPAINSDANVRGGRVIGGEIVEPHTHPYHAGLIVQVDANRTGICSGSVLTTRSILTAALCVYRHESIQVILGAHN
jgi:hypothetical protein